MQWHHGALLDEKEHQAVVIVPTNRDLIEVRVEMVLVEGSICALDSQLLNLNRVHTFNDFLT